MTAPDANMVFDSFFNFPDLKPEEIGGWYFRGHDAKDEYQEFVVKGAETAAVEFYPKDWKDWIRTPLPHGSALLYVAVNL